MSLLYCCSKTSSYFLVGYNFIFSNLYKNSIKLIKNEQVNKYYMMISRLKWGFKPKYFLTTSRENKSGIQIIGNLNQILSSL